jgi:hypothetical protein
MIEPLPVDKPLRPGDRFCVRQGQSTRRDFIPKSRRSRLYYIFFEVGIDGAPIFRGGVKPRPETLEEVRSRLRLRFCGERAPAEN